MKYLYLYLLFVYTFNIGYSAEDISVTKENVNSFQIEKAYTYSDELENYCYLLKPFNIIFDKDKNLYTYDLLQGFMVKYLPNNTFSKIMGNHGPGPGEFRKNGIGYPIYIFVINNKNIAAVELFSNRILIFGENGAFKTESKYKPVNGSKLIIKNSGI